MSVPVAERHEAFRAALGPRSAGAGEPFRAYADPVDADVNWSDEHEELHEEASLDNYIDDWNRRALMDEFAPAIAPSAVIADLGCSSGYLLEDLRERWPDALLVGVDLVASGLRNASRNVPEAELVLADVTRLPFGDATVDAVVSANLLEHVPDDAAALAEVARVLRPGGRAAIIVPAGPRLYDYYDRFLEHERRYGRHELAYLAARAGLRVVRDAYVGSLIYPPFWAVKKRNRRRFGALTDAEVIERVKADIDRTTNSRIGYVACALERRLVRAGAGLPFGIRSLVCAERPQEEGAP
jgi:SAM-dependent methyltransferase